MKAPVYLAELPSSGVFMPTEEARVISLSLSPSEDAAGRHSARCSVCLEEGLGLSPELDAYQGTGVPYMGEGLGRAWHVSPRIWEVITDI